MAEFSVNAQRFDPYKGYMFRVKWDGKYVAGLSKMGALKRTTDPVAHREGGDPAHERKSPGKTHYDAVLLERIEWGNFHGFVTGLKTGGKLVAQGADAWAAYQPAQARANALRDQAHALHKRHEGYSGSTASRMAECQLT